MKKLRLLIPILFLAVLSCKSPDKQETIVNRTFHVPVMVQPKIDHVVKCFEEEHLSSSMFLFRGKHKFADTLFCNDDVYWTDSTFAKDYMREESQPAISDSLSTDGFQIFPDYQTTVYTDRPIYAGVGCFFPVYIVNETSSTKLFYGKDSYGFGIQEAIDASDGDHWRPIEAKGFDFCGNGYFGVKVHPGEFVILLVPKYKGEQKREMRIRLNICESLYVSKAYIGSFSAKQFEIDKETYMYRALHDLKSYNRFGLFYGAIPKGFDQ